MHIPFVRLILAVIAAELVATVAAVRDRRGRLVRRSSSRRNISPR